MLSIALASCASYTPNPNIYHSVNEAKGVIFEFEVKRLERFKYAIPIWGSGMVTTHDIEVTNDYFTDCYIISIRYLGSSNGLIHYEINYGLRKIYFDDIEFVKMENPHPYFAAIWSLVTCGIIGPNMAYILVLTPKADVDWPHEAPDTLNVMWTSTNERNLVYPGQSLWAFFPVWLINPYSTWSNATRVGAAIEFLRLESQQDQTAEQ